MPRATRKTESVNLSSNNSPKKAFSSSTSSSSTSVAALSVSKFGQTSYTSIRRQNEGENGNFVPLKTALENKSPQKVNISQEPQPKNQPKVYKFFKSRTAPSDQSPNGKGTTHNNPKPKPLNLNTASKIDVPKSKIVSPSEKRYTKIKDKNASGSKTLDLSSGDSVVLKDFSEKTIKKEALSKSTRHIIKNNVRKNNVRCVPSPSALAPSQASGVRTSRRLKGIQPDFTKPETENQTTNQENELSTTIEIATVSDLDNKFDDIIKNNPEHLKVDEEISNENSINGDYNQLENDKTKLELPDTAKIENEVCDSKSQLIAHLNIEENKSDESKAVNQLDFNFALGCEDLEMDIDLTPRISESKSTNSDTSKLVPVVKDNEIDTKPSKSETSTTEVVKPKKKTFFNRSRNKVEFNTKSFFNTNSKDEFDPENQTNSASNSNNVSKKHEGDDDSYLKLKRIRKAHQCHDSGETEQFDEDIKYYLSGIISINPVSMRCLSIIALTQHTMRPEFRMHLRAHDDMPQIMKALFDAPNDPNLALCAACLMFVYNQDRMTMDIDPNALSLMLDLLETRSDECNQVEEKHRKNVISLVEEMKNKGYAKYLKVAEITAGKLAMETLLGLTSKRAGDWFKTELRKMKGIDFIVDTVMRCAANHLQEGQMIKIDRCMHVLENVSFDNFENQKYITHYNEGSFIAECITMLEICKEEILKSKESKIFLSAFFSILRVLTNLTSESDEGCRAVGRFPGIVQLLLDSLFELPPIIIQDQRFDLMVIILCLCINLSEFCKEVRSLVIDCDSHIKRLTELLFKKIEEAAQVEQATDHLLESHETVQMTEAMQDNLLMQMISKSGTHMEHSLISACVCLLFGCCIQANDEYRDRLQAILPKHSFDPLIEMLEKLRDFAHLADIMTQKGKDRVTKILKMFKSYKRQQEAPKEEDE